MAGTEHVRRRFITRHDVEDAAAAGRPVVLEGRDLLTDEAAQRAMDLGVKVERPGAGGAGAGRAGAGVASGRSVGTAASAGSAGSAGPAARSPVPDDALRKAVRAAVVAELGREPADLDAVIDRVLARR